MTIITKAATEPPTATPRTAIKYPKGQWTHREEKKHGKINKNI